MKPTLSASVDPSLIVTFPFCVGALYTGALYLEELKTFPFAKARAAETTSQCSVS